MSKTMKSRRPVGIDGVRRATVWSADGKSTENELAHRKDLFDAARNGSAAARRQLWAEYRVKFIVPKKRNGR